MAIQHYAATSFYGYGFMSYNYSPGEHYFISEIYIYGDRNNVFDTKMTDIYLKRKDYDGHLRDIKQSLYLVEDDGVWKEYFSGTEVKYLPERPGSLDDKYGNCCLSHGYFNPDSPSDTKKTGLREFIVSKLTYVEPSQFASWIAQYTDSEIKSMVGQFCTLKKNATTWGIEFDKAVKESKDAKNAKNERSKNDLAGGMGKYSYVKADTAENNMEGDIQAQTDNQGNNVKEHSQMQSDEQKNVAGNKNNKLTVILAVALIIVFILWLIK